MDREQKISKLKELANGKVSPSIKRSNTDGLSKLGREWIASIALIAKRQLRHQNKTQKQLAKEIGVSETQISKWLSGKENFTIDTVSQLSEALGVPLIQPNLNFGEIKQSKTLISIVLSNTRNNSRLQSFSCKSAKIVPFSSYLDSSVLQQQLNY